MGGRQDLLTDLLRGVSRSFYLTLRALPAAIRSQIGLAYLLARATDTIADTEILPIENRLAALELLRERILGSKSSPVDFGDMARQQALSQEGMLLERIEEVIKALGQQSLEDRVLIRRVLEIITSGQELDLRRFGSPSGGQITALRTRDELDDYTYRVAGCVGEFWTEVCLAHLPHAPMRRKTELLENGVRFGKGLQLTNILRDLPRDLRAGRCYLPAEDLQAHGLQPADLLEPANHGRFKVYYNSLLDQTEAHLRAGWEYTNTLPRRWVRVRLACSWPILIGMGTLEKLRCANVLDPAQRVKISRSVVRKIIGKTLALYPWAAAWRRLGEKVESR